MNQAAHPARVEDTWHTLAPFPEPTWELEGVECDGKIYLIGGITNAWGARSGWIPNRMVYAYDPKADSWTKRAQIPVVVHHMAVTELDGMIYGFGGYRTPEQGPDDWEPVAGAWKYDPAADTWTPIAPLPAARGAAAASVLGGKIYVAGGSHACRRKGEQRAKPAAPHTSSADVFVYDPVTNTYSQAAPMLTARNHHLLETLNGKLYALGGRVGSANAFTFTNKIDLVEEYDPADDTWWPRSRMLAAHGGMMSCIHNGALYVCGGDGLRMIEKYDVQADRWSVAAELPRPQLGATGGCVDGRMYVMTGHVRTATGSEPVADNLAIDLA
jgi:N-acetylneuraminic acid mutarotase